MQDDRGNLGITGDLNSELSRALHTMTAHLHRYGSELSCFEEIVVDITSHHQQFLREKRKGVCDDTAISPTSDRLSVDIMQVASQLKTVNRFRMELENKARNILDLVSAVHLLPSILSPLYWLCAVILCAN